MSEIIDLDSDTECTEVTEVPQLIEVDSDAEHTCSVNSRVSGTSSPSEDVSFVSREFDQSYPTWIDDFNKKCSEVVGTKCSKQLDILMEKYLTELRREYEFCSRSPSRSFYVAKQMYKCLIFFYIYYQDVKDFFIASRWTENIIELLVVYCKLEIKSSMRLKRGKETDNMIATRIMNLMWITLENSKINMLHLLLKMVRDSCFTKRQRDIFSPIFRKLLTTRAPRECTDIEYIRLLLSYKSWKRLLYQAEKREISDMCTRLVKQPAGFARSYQRYRFMPFVPPDVNLQEFLITTLFDLPLCIKYYFAYIENKKNKNPIASSEQINKQITFSSDFYINFSTEENIMEDFSQSFLPLLENRKQEKEKTDTTRPNKSRSVDITNEENSEPTFVELIDLTDEDITEPVWVKQIEKIAEEHKQENLEKNLVEVKNKEEDITQNNEQKENCIQADSTVMCSQEISENLTSCSQDLNSHDVSSTNDKSIICSPSSSTRLSAEDVKISEIDKLEESSQSGKDISDVSVPDSCSADEILNMDTSDKIVISKCHSELISKNEQISENCVNNQLKNDVQSVELNLVDKLTKTVNNSVTCNEEKEKRNCISKEETKPPEVEGEKDINTKEKPGDKDINTKEKPGDKDTIFDKNEEEDFITSLYSSEIVTSHVEKSTMSTRNSTRNKITQKSRNIDDLIRDVLKKRDVSEKEIDTHNQKVNCVTGTKSDAEQNSQNIKNELRQCKVQIDKLKIFSNSSDDKLNNKRTDHKDNKLNTKKVLKNNNQNDISNKTNSGSKKEKRVRFSDLVSERFVFNGINNNSYESSKSKKEECILKVYKKNAMVEHEDINIHNTQIDDDNELDSFENNDFRIKSNLKKTNRLTKESDNVEDVKKRKDLGKVDEENVDNINIKETPKRGRRKRDKHKSIDNENMEIDTSTITDTTTPRQLNIVTTRSRHKYKEENLDTEFLINGTSTKEEVDTHKRRRTRNNNDEIIEEKKLKTVPPHKSEKTKRRVSFQLDQASKTCETDNLTPTKKKRDSLQMDVPSTSKSRKNVSSLEISNVRSTSKNRRNSIETVEIDNVLLPSKSNKNFVEVEKTPHSKKEKKDKKKYKILYEATDFSKVKIINENTIQDEEISSNDLKTQSVSESCGEKENGLNNVYNHQRTNRDNICTTPIHIIDDNTISNNDFIVHSEYDHKDPPDCSDYDSASDYGIQSDDLQNIHVTVLEETVEYCEKPEIPQADPAVVSNSVFEQFAEQTITQINRSVNTSNISVINSSVTISDFTDKPSCSDNVFDYANFGTCIGPSGSKIHIENTMDYRDKRKADNIFRHTYRAAKVAKFDKDESIEDSEEPRPVGRVYTKIRTTIGPWEKYLMQKFRFEAEDLRKLDVRLTLNKMSDEEIGNVEYHESIPPPIIKTSTVSGVFDSEMIKLLKGAGSSTILERQDYDKSKNNEAPRARIEKRITNTNIVARNAPVLPSTVQRGTAFSSELDILFTNLDLLSINTPIEHTINVTDLNLPTYCDCPQSDLLITETNLPLSIPSPICQNVCVDVLQETPLPAEIPYWDNFNDIIPNASELINTNVDIPIRNNIDESKLQLDCDSSEIDLMLKAHCTDSPCASPEHETHLPIKKRRVSSLNIVKEEMRDTRDEISYPPTPMMSIAALENMKPHYHSPVINVRDIDDLKPVKFKTPAQLKEVAPLTYNHNPIDQPLSINHTYNNPTINYHIGGVWGAASGSVAPPLACPGPWAPTTCYYAPPPPPTYKKKQSKSQARSKEEKSTRKSRRSRNTNNSF